MDGATESVTLVSGPTDPVVADVKQRIERLRNACRAIDQDGEMSYQVGRVVQERTVLMPDGTAIAAMADGIDDYLPSGAIKPVFERFMIVPDKERKYSAEIITVFRAKADALFDDKDRAYYHLDDRSLDDSYVWSIEGLDVSTVLAAGGATSDSTDIVLRAVSGLATTGARSSSVAVVDGDLGI